MTVARAATNAFTRARIVFVEHDAQRYMERRESSGSEIITKLLDAGFVAYRGMIIRAACMWIGRIFPTLTVNAIEPLGFQIVRL